MANKLKNCRFCKSKMLVDVLDLGILYPSGFIKPDEKVSEDIKTPLILCQCDVCGLIQLRHTVSLDLMYRQYWYASSLNKSMVSSLQNVVDDVEQRNILQDGDLVLDIGCNDGTMLQLYKNKLDLVGFDPALNLEKPNCKFINDYFSASKYNEFTNIKAKVITAIAMFYDLPDPVGFTRDVTQILHEDGIFVIQFTDLVSMMSATAFDNICHEHLEYYRLQDVVNILEAADLQVIDVSYNDVNGGSIRVIASHVGRFIPSENVNLALINEFNYLSNYTIKDFIEKIEKIKFKTVKFLEWLKSHNKLCYLMGASTKGNTLLQVCNITNDLVPYAADVNSDKFGLRTLGSNIEIISETDALIKHPEFFFVPIWHFKKNILSNNKIIDYLKSGGTLVFPLPDFHVVTFDYNNKFLETRI